MTLNDSRRTNMVGSALHTVLNDQICPRCNQKMRVEIIAPTMFLGDTHQITYVCKECGTKELQTIGR